MPLNAQQINLRNKLLDGFDGNQGEFHMPSLRKIVKRVKLAVL